MAPDATTLYPQALAIETPAGMAGAGAEAHEAVDCASPGTISFDRIMSLMLAAVANARAEGRYEKAAGDGGGRNEAYRAGTGSLKARGA